LGGVGGGVEVNNHTNKSQHIEFITRDARFEYTDHNLRVCVVLRFYNTQEESEDILRK
jgi:hypothetical protein